MEQPSLFEILSGIFMVVWAFRWYLLLAMLFSSLPALFRLVKRSIRYWRISQAGLSQVDSMDGEAFEMYLQAMFCRMGYHVKRTPYRGDFGADLVLTKDGKKTAVQAKRANSKIGVKAVQEITAARAHYSCDKALVITNNDFTQQARKLASSNNVEMWNRDKLAEIVTLSERSSVAVEA